MWPDSLPTHITNYLSSVHIHQLHFMATVCSRCYQYYLSIMRAFIDVTLSTICKAINHPIFHTLPNFTDVMLSNYISLMICPTATIHQTTFHLNNTTLSKETSKSKNINLVFGGFSIPTLHWTPLVKPKLLRLQKIKA